MKKPSKTILAALLPLALLLGACGETGDSSLSSPETTSSLNEGSSSSKDSAESSSELDSEIEDSTTSSESEPVVIPIEVEIANPATATIEVGATLQLEFEVRNNEEGLPLEFASDNPEVLTVSEKGLDTAVAKGTANVTLTVGEASDSLTITVVSPAAASIEIVLDHTELDVGETIEVGATILPEAADDDYTVSVSDEIYLSVDGHRVTAMLVSEGPLTITVSTPNGLTDTAEVTIVEPDYVEDMAALLRASAELEKDSLSEATILAESTNSYDFSGEATYRFYSDDAALAEIEHDDGEKASITNFIDGQTLYTVEQNGDGAVESVEAAAITESPDWDEVSPEEAQNAVNMPLYPESYDGLGLSNYILENYLEDSYSGLMSDDATNIELSVEGSTYTLTGEIGDYSSYTYMTVELTLDAKGLVVEGLVDVEIHDVDWDTEKPLPDISEQMTFTFTQTAGERTPSDGHIINLDALQYSDYNLYWSSDYSGATDAGEAPTFETGKTVYIFPKDIAPVTAYYDVDPVSVSVSPSAGASFSAAYSSYSGYFASGSFSAPGHYAITIRTANVEKTIECDVVAPQVEGISFGPSNYGKRNWLPSSIVAGIEHEFLVNLTPSNASGTVHAEIVDDTAGATIEPAQTANSFVVAADHAGTFTVKVYEESLGEEKAITKTVTVYGNDDASIAAMLDGATIADNTGTKTLDFVKTSENGGTFAYHKEEEDYYGDSISYDIAGNFEVSAGELVLSEVTYTCSDDYTDVSAPDYSTPFTNYDFKCFRFDYDVDWDSAVDYVYLK